MIFAGPPEDDIDWADVSPAGSVKWLARVQRVAADVDPASLGSDPATGDREVRTAVHRLVAEIDQLMTHKRLNVAVARLMGLTSVLRKGIDSGPGPADPAVREGAEALVRILSIFAPFTAEEAWLALGREPSVIEYGWPEVDAALLVEDTVTCVVQVAGKVRDRIEVPVGIGDEQLRELALATPGVRRALGGAAVQKVIIRAPRLVNVVPASSSAAVS
jgi:leucyl-tRNA synthetase